MSHRNMPEIQNLPDQCKAVASTGVIKLPPPPLLSAGTNKRVPGGRGRRPGHVTRV